MAQQHWVTQTEWQVLPWARLLGEWMFVTLYTSVCLLQMITTHMRTGRKQPGEGWRPRVCIYPLMALGTTEKTFFKEQLSQ